MFLGQAFSVSRPSCLGQRSEMSGRRNCRPWIYVCLGYPCALDMCPGYAHEDRREHSLRRLLCLDFYTKHQTRRLYATFEPVHRLGGLEQWSPRSTDQPKAIPTVPIYLYLKYHNENTQQCYKRFLETFGASSVMLRGYPFHRGKISTNRCPYESGAAHKLECDLGTLLYFTSGS